jgi:hypothetical protein
MPLSRQYLGVHSSNQVLLGLTFGLLFLILYKYTYQRQIYSIYWKLFTKSKCFFNLIFIIFLHIATVITPIIIFYYNKNNFPVDPHILKAILNQCNTVITG